MRRRPSRVPDDPELSQEMRRFLDELDRRVPNSKLDATAAPAVTDDEDSGYGIGSRWFDVTADQQTAECGGCRYLQKATGRVRRAEGLWRLVRRAIQRSFRCL